MLLVTTSWSLSHPYALHKKANIGKNHQYISIHKFIPNRAQKSSVYKKLKETQQSLQVIYTQRKYSHPALAVSKTNKRKALLPHK
jgi:transposase-like protein